MLWTVVLIAGTILQLRIIYIIMIPVMFNTITMCVIDTFKIYEYHGELKENLNKGRLKKKEITTLTGELNDLRFNLVRYLYRIIYITYDEGDVYGS